MASTVVKPQSLQISVFSTKIQLMKGAPFETNEDCKYASLVDQKWFEKNLTNPFEVRNMSHILVVFDNGKIVNVNTHEYSIMKRRSK